MRAMPSPTWRTVPTSARSVSTSYCSIRSLRIDVISSGRSFTALAPPHEFLTQTFEPAAHACVDAHRAGLQDEAADQARVHSPLRLDLAAGGLFDLLQERARLLVRELV